MINQLISVSAFAHLGNDWLMDTFLVSSLLEPNVEMLTHLYAALFCINPLNTLHLF